MEAPAVASELRPVQSRRISFVASCLIVVVSIATVPALFAAQSADHTMPTQGGNQDQQLAKQLEELRAQVARLQQSLDQQRQSQQPAMPPMGQSPSPGMRMDDDMGRMSQGAMNMGEMGRRSDCCMGMDMHKGEMGMPPEGMKMPMEMMDDMRRMRGMSGASAPNTGGTPGGPGMNMGGMSPMPSASASRSMSSVPGNPGASHIYHIGSTGFFLDQAQISLSGNQQTALNRIKERALLERGDAERRLEQAEQELWALTGAEQPDATRIQAKAREIEQIRTNQRLAFIQAVGEAAKLLTAEQRGQLLGTANAPVK